MEESHTRYGLIIVLCFGDPGSGHARARAIFFEKSRKVGFSRFPDLFNLGTPLRDTAKISSK